MGWASQAITLGTSRARIARPATCEVGNRGSSCRKSEMINVR